MDQSELWNYFWERKVLVSKPLDRVFIWVKKSDFETVKKYFKQEYNLFHPTSSFRSLEFFLHIHAVVEGDLVCIHHDIGNWNRFWPLIIIHFFSDVFFYLIWCWWKGIDVKSLTKPASRS